VRDGWAWTKIKFLIRNPELAEHVGADFKFHERIIAGALRQCGLPELARGYQMNKGKNGRRHIVITGTGRAGTTFLVQLLTRLGLDTGYTRESMLEVSPTANAGLEHDMHNKNCPYIVKSPAFCDCANEILAQPNIKIDHIIIPMRDLREAATSRRAAQMRGLRALSFSQRCIVKLLHRWSMPGGLWGCSSYQPGDQEQVLTNKLYGLLLAASKHNIPITFLHWPRMRQSPHYLWQKLEPMLPNIHGEIFRQAWEEVVMP